MTPTAQSAVGRYTSLSSTRAALSRVVPLRFHARLRRWLRNLPVRLGDASADLRDRFAPPPGIPPLPPARLRARVGFTSSRDEFLTVGSEAAKALLEGLGRVHPSPGAREAWLDFGCGCGRVTRHLLASDRLGTLCGVDVDSSHIRWLRRHVRAEWHPILPKPPTPLGSERFDVVACVSVFTHFDETRQDEWLSELVRLLRPGGFLLATTHGPDLGKVCPGITPEDVERLASFGFLFRALPGGAFSDQAAFHSEQYMTQHWDQRLRLVAWRPKALLGYQDLGIWRRMT